MQDNVQQDNVDQKEVLENTTPEKEEKEENIIIDITENVDVVNNKINNISSISSTSIPNLTSFIEEKYPNGIYTGRIQFSELLNKQDNLIIRQIRSPTTPQPNINVSTKAVSKITIPKKIFQTHKSIEFVRNSPKIKNAIDSWRRHSKEFEYYFYTDEICDKFMKENFEGEW